MAQNNNKGVTRLPGGYARNNSNGLVYPGVSFGFYWGESPKGEGAVFLNDEQTLIALTCQLIAMFPRSSSYKQDLAEYIGKQDARLAVQLLTGKKKIPPRKARNMTLKERVEFLKQRVRG